MGFLNFLSNPNNSSSIQLGGKSWCVEIQVGNNNIQRHGAEALAETLKENKTLQGLDVRFNVPWHWKMAGEKDMSHDRFFQLEKNDFGTSFLMTKRKRGGKENKSVLQHCTTLIHIVYVNYIFPLQRTSKHFFDCIHETLFTATAMPSLFLLVFDIEDLGDIGTTALTNATELDGFGFDPCFCMKLLKTH